jgi:hypothetical protein
VTARGRLVDGGRLASERALLDVENGGDEAHDMHVGGHLVFDLELDDVARDEVPHCEGREPDAIMEHHSVVGLDLPHHMEHFLRVGLRPDADRDIDNEDEEDEDDERFNKGGECELIGEEREEEGDCCGGQEDVHVIVMR